MTALIGSLFYATGAVYGAASGILESTLPKPSAYVPRVLQKAFSKSRASEDGALPFRTGEASQDAVLRDAVLSSAHPSDTGHERHLLQIVVCGAPGVGKTHLLTTWATGQQPTAVQSTVGCDMFRDEIRIGNATVSVVLWDTGPGMHSERLGQAFLSRADAFLIIATVRNFDVESLEALRSGMVQQQQPQPPCALIGLTRDDRDDWEDRDSYDQKEEVDAETWSAMSGIAYFHMSSANDVAAVNAAILWLASNSLATKHSSESCGAAE